MNGLGIIALRVMGWWLAAARAVSGVLGVWNPEGERSKQEHR